MITYLEGMACARHLCECDKKNLLWGFIEGLSALLGQDELLVLFVNQLFVSRALLVKNSDQAMPCQWVSWSLFRRAIYHSVRCSQCQGLQGQLSTSSSWLMVVKLSPAWMVLISDEDLQDWKVFILWLTRISIVVGQSCCCSKYLVTQNTGQWIACEMSMGYCSLLFFRHSSC